MAEIDFITAFARLLRDGQLRDTFAANPETAARQIHLRASDLAAWRQLNPTDVDFQADVLLRKRLDLVRFFAPETCRQAGEKLWPKFREFARACWPVDGEVKFSDALQFCEWLEQQTSGTAVASERNRLRFAKARRAIAFHLVRMCDKQRRSRSGLQIFLRWDRRSWREIFLYAAL